MTEARVVQGSMQRHPRRDVRRNVGARPPGAAVLLGLLGLLVLLVRRVLLAGLVLLAACSRDDSDAPASPEPQPSEPLLPELPPELPPEAMELDDDRVIKLYPDAPGTAYRLGDADPNRAEWLSIEEGGEASPGRDGGVSFWRLDTYAFEYSEGNAPGRTARLHIAAAGAEQRFDWRDQRGFLASPDALGDQELTALVRVHGIVDPERAAFELKVRGGRHTDSAPALASCTLMTFASAQASGVSRFGKELDHPEYDFVNLPLRFPAELVEDRWYGLKLVTFVDPQRSGRVVYRLYVDDDPFLPDGSPRNAFRLLTEYVDRSGTSTGLYDTLVDWRGAVTTLRVDGVESLDVARLSARAIHG